MATSAKAVGLDYGEMINTGDTGYDAQALSNTSIQRTYRDAEAIGINPVAYLLGAGGTSGASSASAISSSATRKQLQQADKQLDINLMNAYSERLQAQAALKNAKANTAKAVSSFMPKSNINFSLIGK